MQYDWKYDDKNNITYDFSEEELKRRKEFLISLDDKLIDKKNNLNTAINTGKFFSLNGAMIKPVIWTDGTGFGKSLQIRKYIADNWKEGFIYACQRQDTIDSIYYDLIASGVPKIEVLKFYSKDNQSQHIEMTLAGDYDLNINASILLITHASLQLEPLGKWKHKRSPFMLRHKNSLNDIKKYLIVDEYCDTYLNVKLPVSNIDNLFTRKLNSDGLISFNLKDKNQMIENNFNIVTHHLEELDSNTKNYTELLNKNTNNLSQLGINFNDKYNMSLLRSESFMSEFAESLSTGNFKNGASKDSYQVAILRDEPDINDKIKYQVYVRQQEDIKNLVSTYSNNPNKSYKIVNSDETKDYYEFTTINEDEVVLTINPALKWEFPIKIILDATGDLVYKESQNYDFVRINEKVKKNVTVNKIISDICTDRTEFDFKKSKDSLLSLLESIIKKALTENKESVLIVYPKFREDRGDKIKKDYIEEFILSLNNPRLKFTCYGSDTSGSNKYLDCDSIILFGNYRMNTEVIQIINDLSKSKAQSLEWTLYMYTQAIGRTKIRLDPENEVNVYSTDNEVYLDELVEYNLFNERINSFFSEDAKFYHQLKYCYKIHRPNIESLYLNNKEDFNFKRIKMTLDEIFELLPKSKKERYKYDDLIEILKNKFELDLIIN